ncbi:MAG: hypothetical protein PHS30_03615 [Bacteroidales bacterium]|nr:hypothetical protein [Bacteroidales bacterium]
MKKRADAEKAARAVAANQPVLATDHFNQVSQNWISESEGQSRIFPVSPL